LLVSFALLFPCISLPLCILQGSYVPLVRNALELDLVLRVGLHAQANCEHELADCCRKAGEESVERLGMDRQSNGFFFFLFFFLFFPTKDHGVTRR
jgi:hypothetical protein